MHVDHDSAIRFALSPKAAAAASTEVECFRHQRADLDCDQTTQRNGNPSGTNTANCPWGNRGRSRSRLGTSGDSLWLIRPDFTDRKVLFGCATFNIARTPILMADSGSTAKFALGPSLACRSERINARFVTPSPISSPPRSLAAAAPPHVAPAALQLQHGWHSGRLRLGTIKPGWS